jgi:hypothetical protein
VDQGPAAQPVSGIVTNLAIAPKVPDKQPAGTSDTDWAKLLSQGLKAAGEGYGSYTKEEIARMNTQAAQLKARNPSVASLLSPTATATPSITPYVLVGAGALGLIALIFALK